jgi:serine/threonine-protein kinase
MGSVWVGRHIALDEPVAIKLLTISKDELDDADVRLQREAKSAARLRSPHVVQLLDYGVDRGVPYIVMELLEGEHLGKRIKRRGRICLAAAVTVVEQMARALRRLHKAGIVHRDIKPANIFLARVDDEEIIKLLDFGVVKALRGSLTGDPTQSNVLLGSANYMSPEQTFGAKDLDHRSDLWSLGAILFEVVTGRMAFDGKSIVKVIMDIRNGPTPVPSTIVPDMPKEIDAFFERALARDPGNRFPSARAMAAEFSTVVKRLGPRAEQTGAPLSDDRSSLVELTSSDFLEILTDITGAPEACAAIPLVPEVHVDTPRKAPASPKAPPPLEERPSIDDRMAIEFAAASVPPKRPTLTPPTLGSPGVFSAPEAPKAKASSRARAKDRIPELIDEGFFALREGNHDRARRCWQEALKRDPSNRALELNLRKLDAKSG